MPIGNRQIGWSNEANLLWEIAKKLERLIQVAGPAPVPPPPPPPPALLMGILNMLPGSITDPNDVSQWNAFFGSSTFTSVTVTESTVTVPSSPTPLPQYDVTLYGSGPFTLTGFKFFSSPSLTYFEDSIGCITVFEQYAIASQSALTRLVLKGVTTFNDQLVNVGNGWDPGTPMVLSLPSITTLGPTVGDDGLFLNSFGGANLTLTVPASLMTCNGGLPDGDIQFLQANNTVTVVTV